MINSLHARSTRTTGESEITAADVTEWNPNPSRFVPSSERPCASAIAVATSVLFKRKNVKPPANTAGSS
jgi:hypothetical protein